MASVTERVIWGMMFCCLETANVSAIVDAKPAVWPLSTAMLADFASRATGQQQQQQGQGQQQQQQQARVLC
jgi:hypothetical protein